MAKTKKTATKDNSAPSALGLVGGAAAGAATGSLLGPARGGGRRHRRWGCGGQLRQLSEGQTKVETKSQAKGRRSLPREKFGWESGRPRDSEEAGGSQESNSDQEASSEKAGSPRSRPGRERANAAPHS